jgi:hypothetical protein
MTGGGVTDLVAEAAQCSAGRSSSAMRIGTINANRNLVMSSQSRVAGEAVVT